MKTKPEIGTAVYTRTGDRVGPWIVYNTDVSGASTLICIARFDHAGGRTYHIVHPCEVEPAKEDTHV